MQFYDVDLYVIFSCTGNVCVCVCSVTVCMCVGYIDVLLDNSTTLKLVSQSELKNSICLPEWEYMMYAERLLVITLVCCMSHAACAQKNRKMTKHEKHMHVSSVVWSH